MPKPFLHPTPTLTTTLALLLVALTLSNARSSTSPHPPVHFNLILAQTADVDSNGIFLHHLLASSPPHNLPNPSLAPAPAFGQFTLLSRSQIENLLRDLHQLHATFTWSGPDAIRVSRRSRPLHETEILELLTLTLQQNHVRDRGKLELTLTRPWPPTLIADEPFTLKILELPALGVTPHFITRFELLLNDERLGSWQLALRARIWRDVPVAQAPLRRGQLLADAPIAIERRDLLTLRDAPGPFSLSDPSLELAESVPAGQPLLARSIRVRAVIQRGHLVDAILLDGGLSVGLKVEALEDGIPGQTIRVRNPRSRRELLGKVHNDQTVLIPL